MRFTLATLCVLVCSIKVGLAQVPFLGSCPDIATMPNFDVARYLGKWYEAERYFAIFEFAGKCVTATYNDSGDSTVHLVNKQISSLTGMHSMIKGEARMQQRMDSAKLSVRFPSLPVVVDAPYWILETDYDTFSVVWSCTNFGLFSTRNAWILTRARHPTLEVMERAYGVVDRNSVSRAYFIRTDQKNCPDSH